MIRRVVCFMSISIACGLGCQREPAVQPDPIMARVVAPDRPTVEVRDLLDVMDLTVWKARVNQDEHHRVEKMSLCVRKRGMAPMTVGTVALGSDEPGSPASPGTVLIALQKLDGRQYKARLIYRGEQGERSARLVVEDPIPSDGPVVSEISSNADVGRTGVVVLVRSGAGSALDLTDSETAAIYLKNE